MLVSPRMKWKSYVHPIPWLFSAKRRILDFGVPTTGANGKVTYALVPELLGIVAGAYNLGAILAVPVVPIVAQWFGRRWSIMIGSIIMCAGAILQGLSVNGNSRLSQEARS